MVNLKSPCWGCGFLWISKNNPICEHCEERIDYVTEVEDLLCHYYEDDDVFTIGYSEKAYSYGY